MEIETYIIWIDYNGGLKDSDRYSLKTKDKEEVLAFIDRVLGERGAFNYHCTQLFYNKAGRLVKEQEYGSR